MNKKGIVRTLRSSQERKEVIMRFVLADGSGVVPCELRGDRIVGVVNDNDEVELIKGKKRNRSGIVRPVKLFNHTTNSMIQVKRRGPLRKFMSFVLSVVASISIGVITALIANSYQKERRFDAPMLKERRELLPETPSLPDGLPFNLDQIPMAILVGVFSAALVFLFIFSRR